MNTPDLDDRDKMKINNSLKTKFEKNRFFMFVASPADGDDSELFQFKFDIQDAENNSLIKNLYTIGLKKNSDKNEILYIWCIETKEQVNNENKKIKKKTPIELKVVFPAGEEQVYSLLE